MSEGERLNLQGQIIAYDIDAELSQLDFKGANLLDAGCGTGNAIEWLGKHHPHLNISGCDISEINLRKAQKAYPQGHFFLSSLEKINAANGCFDRILNRYVFEYFSRPQQVIDEFYRILAPGGQAHIIAVDGVGINLSTMDKEFNHEITNVFSNVGLNLHAARQVPNFLYASHFRQVSVRVTAHYFTGRDRELETENMAIRFEKMADLFTGHLGPQAFKTFKKRYIKEIADEKNSYFFNKFITSAIK